MKYFRVLSLTYAALLTLLLIHPAVDAQTNSGQSSPGQTLLEKKQTEAMNQSRFASLLSASGVRVEATNLFTPGDTYQSLRLQLVTNTGKAASRPLAQTFNSSKTSSERRVGQLPRQRSFELSSQHLVLLTVDAANRLRWWSMVPDPRLLRAEQPDENNRLSGTLIYQTNVEALFEIPDDPQATELRFYHPQWTGDGFVLTLVSSLSLTKN